MAMALLQSDGNGVELHRGGAAHHCECTETVQLKLLILCYINFNSINFGREEERKREKERKKGKGRQARKWRGKNDVQMT